MLYNWHHTVCFFWVFKKLKFQGNWMYLSKMFFVLCGFLLLFICHIHSGSMISLVIWHLMGKGEKNGLTHHCRTLTVWTILLYEVGPERLSQWQETVSSSSTLYNGNPKASHTYFAIGNGTERVWFLCFAVLQNVGPINCSFIVMDCFIQNWLGRLHCRAGETVPVRTK